MASIVHYKQFREWRLSGVAFEFGDQTYTQPNRTMASYAEVRTLPRLASPRQRGPTPTASTVNETHPAPFEA